MRYIDIISPSPENFIFQKNSNKTILGGMISLIYFVSILLIFLTYGSLFFLNETYEITSFTSGERLLPKDQVKKLFESEKYNPTLNISFELLDNNERLYPGNRFILFDEITGEIINFSKFIKRRIDDIHFTLYYLCKENETSCDFDQYDRKYFYKLAFYFNGFAFEPQGDLPIYPMKEINRQTFYINPDIITRQMLQWNIIRYEDAKGLSRLFDIFKEEEPDNIREEGMYIGGRFLDFKTHSISNDINTFRNYRMVFKFEVIGSYYTDRFIYDDYKRKRKSILDSLANIFSLWISLYNAFTFLFAVLYSKNFDKYKIIENIISKNKENLHKNNIILLKDKNIKNKNEKVDILLEKEDKENLVINDDNLNENDNYDYKDENDDKVRILPKLRFFDFILNNVYSEKCCIYKKQMIISICNDIILKYYSIENIIHNQFIIENILEDYKWNNNNLKDIINNKAFIKLKNLLDNNF